ncbi:hypothetical protein GCM10027033_21040 [Leucobacter ruminantium]
MRSLRPRIVSSGASVAPSALRLVVSVVVLMIRDPFCRGSGVGLPAELASTVRTGGGGRDAAAGGRARRRPQPPGAP